MKATYKSAALLNALYCIYIISYQKSDWFAIITSNKLFKNSVYVLTFNKNQHKVPREIIKSFA